MEVYLILNRKARNIDFYRNLGIIRSFFLESTYRLPVKNYLAFFSAKGIHPPFPLAENHFDKTPITEMGVPPPPLKKIAENFPKKWAKKG